MEPLLYLITIAPLVLFFVGLWLWNRRINRQLDDFLERKHRTIQDAARTPCQTHP